MDCWILYDPIDLEQNRFFAERLRSSGEELGLECDIVTSDNMILDDAPEIVVSRTRDPELVSQLEDYGSTVFNRSSVSRICKTGETVKKVKTLRGRSAFFTNITTFAPAKRASPVRPAPSESPRMGT